MTRLVSIASMLVIASSLAACATNGGASSRQVTADVGAWAQAANDQASALASTPQANAASAAAANRAMAQASLLELYESGLSYNPHVSAARARISVADAELTNAAFRFFPSLTGTVTRSWSAQNILNSDNKVFQQGHAEYGTSNAALEARMPIFNLENAFNLQKSDAQQRRSYVEYVGAAQTYIRDLMVAYIDLAEANAIIDEYRQRAQLLQARAQSERARQAQGGGSAELALGFEQEQSDAQAQLVVQEARQRSVIIRIEELTGVRVGAVRGHVSVASLKLPLDNVDGLIALALANNPKYVAKTYELNAFDAEIRRALAKDFSPTFDAFASHEWEDRGGSQFGGGSETVQTIVGVQLTVPIFNADGNGYQSQTAMARTQLATAEVAMVASETKAGVATAFANYQAARIRIQRDSATIGKGSDLISLVNQRVAGAGGTVDDGMQAKLDLASYLRQRQQAQFQMLREWVNIKHLTGALSEADVRTFSGTNL